MQGLIDKIYEKIKDVIVDGIEPEKQKEALQEYYRLLSLRYSDYEGTLTEEQYDKVCDLELKQWQRLSPMAKKKIVIADNILESIRSISLEALGFAKKKQESEYQIPAKLADNNVDLLSQLLDRVNKENKEEATMLVSEGILDLKYASGQSELYSLRMGDCKTR